MVATPATLPRKNPPNGRGRGGYEEYSPYGATTWQAVGIATVSLKRYKYTGMERDEETGLQRHGVRYYAPWLGRWTSADPIGLGDGVNRFEYCQDNPIVEIDPTGLSPGPLVHEEGALGHPGRVMPETTQQEQDAALQRLEAGTGGVGLDPRLADPAWATERAAVIEAFKAMIQTRLGLELVGELDRQVADDPDLVVVLRTRDILGDPINNVDRVGTTHAMGGEFISARVLAPRQQTGALVDLLSTGEQVRAKGNNGEPALLTPDQMLFHELGHALAMVLGVQLPTTNEEWMEAHPNQAAAVAGFAADPAYRGDAEDKLLIEGTQAFHSATGGIWADSPIAKKIAVVGRYNENAYLAAKGGKDEQFRQFHRGDVLRTEPWRAR